MLASNFSEAHNKEVLWEDEDPNVVKLLVEWLYFQILNIDNHTVTREASADRYAIDPELVVSSTGDRDEQNANLSTTGNPSNDALLTEQQQASASPAAEPLVGPASTEESTIAVFPTAQAPEGSSLATQPQDDSRSSDTVRSDSEDDEEEEEHNVQHDRLKYLALFKLWCLATKRRLIILSNAAMTALHKLASYTSSPVPAVADIMWAWENTASDHNLRKFLVDFFVVTQDLQSFNDEGYMLPNSLQRAMIRRLDQLRRQPAFVQEGRSLWGKLDVCQWHDHPDGLHCHGKPVGETDKRYVSF